MEIEKKFKEVYDQYYEKVMRYICRYVTRKEIAEELAQDVFLKLYENGYDLVPDSTKTKNLLYTAARHYAYDHLKKKRVEEKSYKQVHFEEVTFDKNFYQDIEEIYIEGHIVAAVHDAINNFPENERDILLRKLFLDQHDYYLTSNHIISNYNIKKIEKSLKATLRKKLNGFFTNE